MVIVKLEGGKYIRKNHNFECMDNIQFWLYVIIAVIALIAQMRKKKRDQSAPAQPRPGRTSAQSQQEIGEESRREVVNKPVSFEDLLKEILEAKEPAIPEPEPEEYLEVEKETKYREYEKDETFDLYKKSAKEAAESKTLEESIRKLESQVKYEHFEHYEVESAEHPAARLLKELKEPGGMKKAIIFSEILNRKHF